MSWTAIESNWQHLKETVQKEWDNLSDDAFEQIAGQRSQLAARIQEAYGISKAEAEAQVEAFEKVHQGDRPT
jgi:uncharacterized protein YjbJ (UPF0337 family)